MEEEIEYDGYNRYYRNEIYTELEDYIADMRKRLSVERGKNYPKCRNIFPSINTNKALVALEIMRWLKPTVEVDTFRLDCL